MRLRFPKHFRSALHLVQYLVQGFFPSISRTLENCTRVKANLESEVVEVINYYWFTTLNSLKHYFSTTSKHTG